MWKALVCSGLLTVVVGCGGGGDGRPEPVSVSGVVTLDDQPLIDAEVKFFNAGTGGAAKTDAQGRYELVPGAVPGENRVQVSKWAGDNLPMTPEGEVDTGQIESMLEAAAQSGQRNPNLPKQLVPKKYSDPASSELTFTVPEDGTEAANFDLKSE